MLRIPKRSAIASCRSWICAVAIEWAAATIFILTLDLHLLALFPRTTAIRLLLQAGTAAIAGFAWYCGRQWSIGRRLRSVLLPVWIGLLTALLADRVSQFNAAAEVEPVVSLPTVVAISACGITLLSMLSFLVANTTDAGGRRRTVIGSLIGTVAALAITLLTASVWVTLLTGAAWFGSFMIARQGLRARSANSPDLKRSPASWRARSMRMAAIVTSVVVPLLYETALPGIADRIAKADAALIAAVYQEINPSVPNVTHDVDFNREIKPILASTCFSCHGPDEASRQAGLRLDVRKAAVASRAIVPGNPNASLLIQRICSTSSEERMPPLKSPLTAEQIQTLSDWISAGAKYDDHWAFRRPVQPKIPVAKDPSWIRNPVDAFVAAGHEAHGLHPAPEADRRTLLRRLSLDLTGLPPSAEDVESFVNDRSTDAYEKVVDRLLASPHYGERMAVYWLDLVRYADTEGYSVDADRQVWMFRDFVIDAFNRNTPFDQFTIRQLAGDLLKNASQEDRVASGYNCLLMNSQEACAEPEERRAKYYSDRVRNLSSVWLGLTMGCAECHDHKFDPLTTKEFYQLSAFFADIQEKIPGPQTPTSFSNPKPPTTDADPNTTLVTASGPKRIIRVLPRGDWHDRSGEVVHPNVPAVLHGIPRAKSRLDLADWIVARNNPLTARVMVNRLWRIAFGNALVPTLEDFGTQGSYPTHPELLDWLAVRFQETGWDVKGMLRLLVTSSTYRQSSFADPALQEFDPRNVWLARQNRFRLDAEFIRDNALTISGLLCRKVGGESFRPYQPEGYWAVREHHKTYEPTTGPMQYRRGLYIFWCRNYLHPSLLLFDAPSRQACTVERPRSATPLQALALLNDPTQVEAARAFAGRLIHERDDTARRIDRAYELALARPPTDSERSYLVEYYDQELEYLKTHSSASATAASCNDTPSPPDADQAEIAAWSSIARIILNLRETITRY